jgi:hypothetical protein
LLRARHYYWCIESDKVSWFPPGHPKACPVVAAAKVRENISSHSNSPEKESDREMVMHLTQFYYFFFFNYILTNIYFRVVTINQ